MKPACLLPRSGLHRNTLILAVAIVAFMAGGSANAKKTFSVSGVCSGGGQLCNNIATFAINVPGAGGVGQGQFIPGPLTCSNVRIHFLIDGTEVAVTGFVGPGSSTFVSLGSIGHGKHTVGVQAEGEVSGCNVGTLLSWAGTVNLMKAP